MGTEYCLGNHGDEDTPQGIGISLMAYEMSGTFDVYVDLPKEKVDLDAWDNAARIDVWEKIDPSKLLKIGKNFIRIAQQHMGEEFLLREEHELDDFVQQANACQRKTVVNKESPKDKEEAALALVDALDCRSEEGVTVGLIDALITVARVLVHRDLAPAAVVEALKDLADDEDVKTIMDSAKSLAGTENK
jgi:hypothetical protein